MKVYVSFYPTKKGIYGFYHSEKEAREAVKVINETSEKEEKLQVGSVEMTKRELIDMFKA